MSDNNNKAAAPVADAFVSSDVPLSAVLPSGTVPSGISPTNPALYAVWLPQTFPGAVVSGYAQPQLSGTGYAGQNTTGFVYQNDQYNTAIRGF